jgi:hypothetical protein
MDVNPTGARNGHEFVLAQRLAAPAAATKAVAALQGQPEHEA